jgi:glycosyltransferase involved in cell wall biosynthesis
MTNKTIYINCTLFINTPLDSNFHGIIRTEVEFLIYLTKNFPDKFQYFYFENEITPQYIIVSELDIKNKLNQIENKNTYSNTGKKRVKQILYKLFPNKLINKLNDFYNDKFSSNKKSHNNSPKVETKTIIFKENSTIISLDPDFLHLDLMKDLYKLKNDLNLKIIMICYDLIPVLFPEFCVDVIKNNFPLWLELLSDTADEVVCISQNTKNDLHKYLEKRQLIIPDLRVIYLGDDSVNKNLGNNISPKISSLLNDKYIVYLASFEPRKNHQLIIDAYKLMIERKEKSIPKIYLVGTSGWKNKTIIEQINSDQKLKKHIKILRNVNDTDLTALFQNSLFSIYPSLYEGWGLPIRESLKNGKFCLSSNTSSMMEAGGQFVEYIEPNNPAKWVTSIIKYSQDKESLCRKEDEIGRNYRPISWDSFGKEVLDLS